MTLEPFRALVADQYGDDVSVSVRFVKEEELPQGDLLVKVAYSSLNYKDALACRADGKIVSQYPHIPGIDLAGTVVQSRSLRFREGDPVVVTGYGLGVSQHGGFSEYARIPAEWAVPLPEPLTLRESMAFGTAGFTAALSLERLEQNGLKPEDGPVLVTGATGGVGSLSVLMLARAGYEVVASTGKAAERDYLRTLGASAVLDRSELEQPTGPLGRQQWAAAVDPVGGTSIPAILAGIRYGGGVALSGMTGGGGFSATVYPFILRGISLLGIDSVFCPYELRLRLWQQLAERFAGESVLETVAEDISLDELPDKLAAITAGRMRGRARIRL
ncbi:putative quinone oxidoreductase YhfP [Paenibacillus sp. J31TS4]|uniref:acrylyl-CoA reductase family protein n=1 Tax=Paenibacillus sp. J31TS4 TaxID=2807195 RepID=UPI001B03471A|nr:acryloyl-CoA reductase [Paenibacillus sp. J31TS4]GIP37224.1 putative quinone oxidoreductase YhfP [Paenibacillus sp. J31TS4]